jgi:basic membrane protein A and related proteins
MDNGLRRGGTLRRLRSLPLALVAAAVLALGVATALGGQVSSASDHPKVAALFTQFVSQGNWDPAGYKAFSAMAKKYGFDPSYVEQASYERAPSILRNLAQRGVKLIILHSSGYAAAVEEVAPDFPDTQFVVFSYAADTKGLKNYSAWSNDWDQYGYVVGVIGGSATKSNNIAIIGGQPIPSTKRAITFMKRGIKKVDPKAKVSVSYIGSFTDAAKGKEIALQAIAKGADFLIPLADTAGAGVQQAAQDKGVLTLGEYIDQHKSYPKAIVTSTIVNMDRAYDQIGRAFKAGALHGQIVQMNVPKGDLRLVTPFRNVPPAVQKKALQVLAQIRARKIDVTKA